MSLENVKTLIKNLVADYELSKKQIDEILEDYWLDECENLLLVLETNDITNEEATEILEGWIKEKQYWKWCANGPNFNNYIQQTTERLLKSARRELTSEAKMHQAVIEIVGGFEFINKDLTNAAKMELLNKYLQELKAKTTKQKEIMEMEKIKDCLDDFIYIPLSGFEEILKTICR